jgi:hypothetical protein
MAIRLRWDKTYKERIIVILSVAKDLGAPGDSSQAQNDKGCPVLDE